MSTTGSTRGHDSHPNPHPRPIGRIITLITSVPLLCGVIAVPLLLSWRSELPDPIASHWGRAGQPDGFNSVIGSVAVTAGILAVLVALAVAAALVLKAPSQVRFATGLVAFIAVTAAGLPVATAAPQRGLAEATQASIAGWPIAAVLVLAAVIGLGSGALVPSWSVRSTTEPAGVAGRPIELNESDRVSWTRSVGSPWPVALIIASSVVVTAVVAMITGLWGLLGITAMLLVLAVVMFAIRVTVDDSGVTVRSLVRWPHSHIPLDQITDARVVQVSALRDFGGYGFRVGIGGPLGTAKGWVLRSGPALLMDRADGSSDLVVVEDAATAAGLVNALRQRAAH